MGNNWDQPAAVNDLSDSHPKPSATSIADDHDTSIDAVPFVRLDGREFYAPQDDLLTGGTLVPTDPTAALPVSIIPDEGMAGSSWDEIATSMRDGSPQVTVAHSTSSRLYRHARVAQYGVASGGLVAAGMNLWLALSGVSSDLLADIVTWPAVWLQPVLLIIAALVILGLALGSSGFEQLSSGKARAARVARWVCVAGAAPTVAVIVAAILLAGLVLLVVGCLLRCLASG